MTAEITLLAEPTDAVMLPRSVVTLSGDGDLGIRAVDKDNKVVFFPIDLVDDTPNGLVLGGIPADARVIVAGQDLVTEGDEVKPVEADAGHDQETRRRSNRAGRSSHGYRQACDPQCASDAFGPAVPGDRGSARLSSPCRRRPSPTSPFRSCMSAWSIRASRPRIPNACCSAGRIAAQEPQGAQGDEVRPPIRAAAYVLVEFDPSDRSRRRAASTPATRCRTPSATCRRASRSRPSTRSTSPNFRSSVVTLSGDVPGTRADGGRARPCATASRKCPACWRATIQGSRDELVEAIIDPMKLSSYGLQLDQLIQGIGASNSLVAAGAIEGSEGKYAVKVPALIETPEDVANLPVVAGPNAVVRVQRSRHGPLDLQGCRDDHPPRRQAGDRHRGQEAHRRQCGRDDRGRQGGCRRVRAQSMPEGD